jgi:hypothetical protein
VRWNHTDLLYTTVFFNPSKGDFLSLEFLAWGAVLNDEIVSMMVVVCISLFVKHVVENESFLVMGFMLSIFQPWMLAVLKGFGFENELES